MKSWRQQTCRTVKLHFPLVNQTKNQIPKMMFNHFTANPNSLLIPTDRLKTYRPNRMPPQHFNAFEAPLFFRRPS